MRIALITWSRLTPRSRPAEEVTTRCSCSRVSTLCRLASESKTAATRNTEPAITTPAATIELPRARCEVGFGHDLIEPTGSRHGQHEVFAVALVDAHLLAVGHLRR